MISFTLKSLQQNLHAIFNDNPSAYITINQVSQLISTITNWSECHFGISSFLFCFLALSKVSSTQLDERLIISGLQKEHKGRAPFWYIKLIEYRNRKTLFTDTLQGYNYYHDQSAKTQLSAFIHSAIQYTKPVTSTMLNTMHMKNHKLIELLGDAKRGHCTFQLPPSHPMKQQCLSWKWCFLWYIIVQFKFYIMHKRQVTDL